MNRTCLVLATLLVPLTLSPARADLVAFYSFDDEAAPLADDSGNSRTLTVGSATSPTWGATIGFIGSGAFDFSTHYLIAPVDVNPTAMPLMTWGAWVRTDSISPGLRKVLGHDNGAWDRTLGLDDRNPNGSFRYAAFTGDDAVNNSGPVEGTPAPVSTSDWAFIAASHNQTTKMVTVYVDLDATTTDDALVAVTEPAGFGAGFNTFAIGGIRPDVVSESWDGAIDNVFIYDEVPDLARMTEIRDGGKSTIIGSLTDPEITLVHAAPLFGDLRSLGAAPSPIVRTITVRNAGTLNALTLQTFTLTGPDNINYSHNGIPMTVIAPGATELVNVTLTPPSVGGVFVASLEIASSDAINPTVSIPLDAQILSDPNILLVADSPLFATLSTSGSVTKSIKVRNDGGALDLTISDSRITGANADRYTLGTLPETIPAGMEAPLEITFNDGGSAGSYIASLEIDSNDSDTPTVSLSLDATSPLPTPQGQLIAFYSFDDSDSPLEDDSGQTGSAALGGGTPVHDPVNGFEGGCYQFNGTSWLTVPRDINPTTLPHLTLGAWVRTDTVATNVLPKIMGHDNGAWDRTLGLDNRTTPQGGNDAATTRYTAFTGTNDFGPMQFTPRPTSTTDYSFVAATYDETNDLVTVYVDLDASTTDDAPVRRTSPSAMGPGLSTLAIGALRPDNGAEGWIGCVDNVFLFDGVLSETEIANLRDSGKAAFLASDNFRITSVVRNPDNTITLTWNSKPGKTYKVRFNTELETPRTDWPDDSDSVPTGGAVTTYTTESAFPQPVMFFVIEENP